MSWEDMPEKIKQRYNWKDGYLYIGKKELANYYIRVVAYLNSPSGKEYVKIQYVVDEMEEVYEDLIEFDEDIFMSKTPPNICKNKCIVLSKAKKRDVWILLQRQLVNRNKDGWILDRLGWNQIRNRWVYCTGNEMIVPSDFSENLFVFPELEEKFQISCADNMSEKEVLNQICGSHLLKSPVPCVCLLYHVTSLLRELLFHAGVEQQFVLYIYGKTSTFKTTTAKYFFDIYRKKTGKSVACADLSSSEVALETMVSEFKDCVFILDDLSPSNTKAEMNKKTNRVNNLIRTVSNCEIRYVQSGNNVTGKEIQCALALTAEYPPMVESIMNRTIILNTEEFPLSEETLNLYRNRPFLINNFTHSFLKWVVENAEKIQEWANEYWQDICDGFVPNSYLRRMAVSLKVLWVSARILIKFLRENDIETEQIPSAISEVLCKVCISEKSQLEALNKNRGSEAKISEVIVKLVQNGDIAYFLPQITNHGARCDYYFDKERKYILISTDYLVQKVNELIENGVYSKISIGKKLKFEGVLYLEEGRNIVKREGRSYYKINIKALQDVTGIDIYGILIK